VDIVALVAVLFGIVASLGQGVFQMGGGLGVVGVGTIEPDLGRQLAILFVVSAAFLASAALGLKRGIAVLSNVNLTLAGLLALFVIAMVPLGAIGEALWQSAAGYLRQIPALSVELRPEGAPREWTRDWSLTYFLWWVAWTPFVGVFLARISRGRTVRSFLAMAVLMPSVATLLWFSIFAGAAFELAQGGVDFGVDSFDTAPQATYALLAELPLPAISSVLTLLLVAVFLVTSADSGAYVLAMLSGGESEPAVAPRLLWGGVLALLTAAAIISEGGQTVTRAMAVAGALPMTFLLAAQGAVTLWQARPRAANRD
jgi:choline-glycine betaine transporter